LQSDTNSEEPEECTRSGMLYAELMSISDLRARGLV